MFWIINLGEYFKKSSQWLTRGHPLTSGRYYNNISSQGWGMDESKQLVTTAKWHLVHITNDSRSATMIFHWKPRGSTLYFIAYGLSSPVFTYLVKELMLMHSFFYRYVNSPRDIISSNTKPVLINLNIIHMIVYSAFWTIEQLCQLHMFTIYSNGSNSVVMRSWFKYITNVYTRIMFLTKLNSYQHLAKYIWNKNTR